LISTDGVSKYASAPSIDHMGILAGTVGRAAAVLDVAAESAIGAIDGSVSGMRLGYLPTRSLASLGATEAVIDAYSAAVSQLAELGAAVVDVDPPRIGLAPQAVFTIFPVELAAAHGSLIDRRPDDYTVAVRELLQLGRAIPGSWYESAQRFRRTLSSTLALAFESEQLDALLTPTAPREAMPLADLDPGQDLAPLVAFTCPFNLTGQPAMSLPCGQVDGLPVGLQVVGRPLDERSVLRVGKAYESATDWHKRKPPNTLVGQSA
jgi:aspartyl-tRNA(Asn)/glutamyl-tRNA(Gln) amidotransferase subunit A